MKQDAQKTNSINAKNPSPTSCRVILSLKGREKRVGVDPELALPAGVG